MKKHNLIAFGFGIALLATACKKTDVQEAKVQTPQATAVEKNWSSLNNWTRQSEENSAVFSNKVEDPSITAAIAKGGMVLAYKKNGNTITALPAEEKNGTASYFWYYQVSEGTIVFNAEANGNATSPASSNAFKYFVISAEQLKEFEQKGYSRGELMRLTYENAQALLKS
jgi:hypothetical protein